MYILMVLMMARLRADHVASSAGYHDIGDHVIYRVTVTAVTAAALAGLTWSGVLVVVVGCVFGGVGCHAMIKGAELSCELDYVISFWS